MMLLENLLRGESFPLLGATPQTLLFLVAYKNLLGGESFPLLLKFIMGREFSPVRRKFVKGREFRPVIKNLLRGESFALLLKFVTGREFCRAGPFREPKPVYSLVWLYLMRPSVCLSSERLHIFLSVEISIPSCCAPVQDTQVHQRPTERCAKQSSLARQRQGRWDDDPPALLRTLPVGSRRDSECFGVLRLAPTHSNSKSWLSARYPRYPVGSTVFNVPSLSLSGTPSRGVRHLGIASQA